MGKIQQNPTEISLRKTILNCVNSAQGLKGVELVLKVMATYGPNPTRLNNNQYNLELERLVEEKEIVEIEYILPSIDYRIKSIYFPKGTTIKRGDK